MRKRRMLQNPFSLAALAVCGVLLAGCGDDGGGSNFDLSDPDPNHAPVCSIVNAFVDLATQEIVVEVLIYDVDQIDKSFPMTVSIQEVTSSGTFSNDIVSSSTGNLIIGNQVFNVDYGLLAPGVQTTFRIDSQNPQLLPSDPNSSVRVTVTDKVNASTFCTSAVDLSLLLSEPDCAILSPGAADIGAGIIPIGVQVSDNQGDAADLNAFYSFDGGTTLQPATLTATTAGSLGVTASCHTGNNGGVSNGVINIPTNLGGAPTAFTVSWDSAADGVGLAAIANVTLVIFVEDCTTLPIGGVFNAPCTQATQVLNNGAPLCSVTAPAGGSSVGGTGTVTIDYTTTDADSSPVSATISWSTNGGTTFSTATAAAGFSNPQSAAPGAQSFGWDAPADIAVAALPVNVIIRITVDDLTGRPTLPTCDGAQFTLVPISEPTCAITAPAAGVCVDAFPAGTAAVTFNLTDSQGDPISFSACYNAGGGNIPMTLTGTTNGIQAAYVPTNGAACAGASNQVTGAAGGSTTITWDFLADGLGGQTCSNVTVTIFPEDGTTGGTGPFFTCNQAFSVSNNGAPSCTVTGVSDTNVTYTATDADSGMVSVLFQYSTTGAGGPFINMTPSAGTNPRNVAPAAGLMFPWAGTTDIPTCTTGVVVRITIDDGVALGNRPATCASAPTDINCIPVLANCRTLGDGVALGTAVTPPTGVVPANIAGAGSPPAGGDIGGISGTSANFWNFDYNGENVGEFTNVVQLVDQGGNNVGNPVLLLSAGHDYSAIMDGGVCNPVDTFQMGLEGDIGGTLFDFSPNMTAAAGGTTATVTTTWTSSAAGNLTISADGLLTAVSENSCTVITWSMMSSDPLALTVDPTCAGPFTFAACVDSAGWDSATRGTSLPVGDLDGNMPGLPSGRPVGGAAGGDTAVTWIVNSGATGVAAYAVRSEFDNTILDSDCTVDTQSVGGSSENSIDPFAVNGCMATAFATVENDASRWNGIDAFGTNSGIFDLSTQTFNRIGAGTVTVHIVNEELADTMACNIWINNPCMPFNSFAPCMTPPMGGYFTIAGTASIVVP